MRRGNDHPNPNKGMTKEALKLELDTLVSRYTSQFGNRQWIIETIEEEEQSVRDMPY